MSAGATAFVAGDKFERHSREVGQRTASQERWEAGFSRQIDICESRLPKKALGVIQTQDSRARGQLYLLEVNLPAGGAFPAGVSGGAGRADAASKTEPDLALALLLNMV